MIIKSIRLQLTGWYIGTISVLFALFGIIAYFSLQAILVKNLDDTLYNGGKILETALTEYTLKTASDPKSLYEPAEDGDEFFVDEIDEEIHEIFYINIVYIQLLTAPHTVGAEPQLIVKTTTLEEHVFPLSPKAVQTFQETDSLVETFPALLPFPVRVLSLLVHDMEGRPYVLQVGMSLQNVRATLRNMFFIFAVLFPALLVILSVLGYAFMKRAFSPIKKMVAVTKRITAEDLSLRLDSIESHDEIGELAATLNDMIDRLESSFKQITQFSGDVAHELKTPLAELKCNAEVALRRDRPREEYRVALQNVIDDVGHLQHIIENLLLLAGMDAQSSALTFMPVALNEVFLEVFEAVHPLAAEKNLALHFEEIEAPVIQGERGLLSRAVTNLLLNAIQYTAPGGEISFSLHQNSRHAIFTISDSGIGIPEKSVPYIFDRFYRVEQSRSQETGGSGLGLAIVQKIIELHAGSISVHSAEGQGSAFSVRLPC